MIGIKELEELLCTVILTGRVQGRKPVSIFLIAKPESGKTTIVSTSAPETEGEPIAVQVSDATGMGLIHLCQRHPRATHVIYNDLTVVSGHGKSTQKYLQSMLNAMTEEGIREIWTPAGPQKIEGGTKGLIAAATPMAVKDGRMWWKRIGLDTRCIPVFYCYREPLVFRVQDGLIYGFGNGRSVRKFPKIPIRVAIPKRLKHTIIDAANLKAKEFDEMGIRKADQFATLLSAHAILRTWRNPSVTDKDISWLYSAMKFMSWSKAVEIG